jgi:hypothetical protein
VDREHANQGASSDSSPSVAEGEDQQDAQGAEDAECVVCNRSCAIEAEQRHPNHYKAEQMIAAGPVAVSEIEMFLRNCTGSIVRPSAAREAGFGIQLR